VAEAYFGRMQAYRAALVSPAQLAEALRKNVYGEATPPSEAQLAALCEGVSAFLPSLQALSAQQWMQPLNA
jgi:hypothetical protein